MGKNCSTWKLESAQFHVFYYSLYVRSLLAIILHLSTLHIHILHRAHSTEHRHIQMLKEKIVKLVAMNFTGNQIKRSFLALTILTGIRNTFIFKIHVLAI